MRRIKPRYIVAGIVLVANAMFMYFSLRPQPHREITFEDACKAFEKQKVIGIEYYDVNDDPTEEQGSEKQYLKLTDSGTHGYRKR